MSEITPTGRPPFSSELYAAGRIIGNKCYDENFEYMKCKVKDDAPAACTSEGERVHTCVYALYKEIAGKAPKQFEALSQCLDYYDLQSHSCKKEQAAFEKAFYRS